MCHASNIMLNHRQTYIIIITIVIFSAVFGKGWEQIVREREKSREIESERNRFGVKEWEKKNRKFIAGFDGTWIAPVSQIYCLCECVCVCAMSLLNFFQNLKFAACEIISSYVAVLPRNCKFHNTNIFWALALRLHIHRFSSHKHRKSFNQPFWLLYLN